MIATQQETPTRNDLSRGSGGMNLEIRNSGREVQIPAFQLSRFKSPSRALHLCLSVSVRGFLRMRRFVAALAFFVAYAVQAHASLDQAIIEPLEVRLSYARAGD